MIDARGYSCPIPVVMVQQQIRKEHPQTLEVLVDNEAALGNITRFARNQGYSVASERTGDGDHRLTLQK